MKLTSEQKVALVLARKTLEFELKLAENICSVAAWEAKEKFKQEYCRVTGEDHASISV